ncbi:MAG: prephenate dehydrogenase [Gracilibacteraceae bacterium]|nr:prephenate dehydrogenase [Gracilibacteraceae bacterium]
MKIAVAGLGLIGASCAGAIKAYTEDEVVGIDLSADVLAQAQRDGVIDSANPQDITQARLVLIALWPGAAREFFTEYLEIFGKNAVLIDFCGVKRALRRDAREALAARPDLVYIGGHPMAGRERWGYEYASPALFQGASMILTPDADTPPETLAWAEDFFRRLGFAGVVRTSPERHDRVVALTSQLAHIVSSAYVQNPLALEHQGLSAGSFADMTRVARLNEDMWTELFLRNSDYLTGHLDDLIERLAAFRAALAAGRAEELREMLARGRERKEALEALELLSEAK